MVVASSLILSFPGFAEEVCKKKIPLVTFNVYTDGKPAF
jgi:hypothetical protein